MSDRLEGQGNLDKRSDTAKPVITAGNRVITLKDLQDYVAWHYKEHTVKPGEPQHVIPHSVLETFTEWVVWHDEELAVGAEPVSKNSSSRLPKNAELKLKGEKE